ncbi:MAG: ABC transporter ATP-binding protein [Myxococcales bacterium]|nr:ABC transporter ATP-binding protein [Myxococcales bacterium]
MGRVEGYTGETQERSEDLETQEIRQPLRSLLRYGRRHRRQMWLATWYSILNKIFDLAPPILIGAAVDVVVRKQDSLLGVFGATDPFTQLWILGGLTVVIWALESVFEYAYAVAWRELAQTIQHELRLDAYSHIQTLEMSYFDEQRTGELMSILNDDINQLERFLDSGANDLLQVATTVVVTGAVFFWMSPQIALWAIAPMPLVLWGSFWFQARIAPRYASVREQAGALNSLLSNHLSGIEVIKSFTTEDFERGRLEEQSQLYRERNRAAIQLSALFVPLIRMVIVVGFSATLLLGGWYTLRGTMAVGAYSVLIFLTQRLLWPLTRLGNTFDLYQRAMASTQRVLGLLGRPVQVSGGEKQLDLTKVRGELGFEHVTFAYDGMPPLFQDLSLRVPAGETWALVGTTGSGKSTLVRLLLRFYEPQQGDILLDGEDIRSLQLASLRGAIGLVSQHVFLFHGSVRENIAYGSPHATHEAIERAAKLAEAHPFIERLPQGYDTLIGDRGQKLSGGQRQRLSIARALLKDPPILILDEATSAIDNETEAAIQRSLEKITVERTTLVIAHRLSTIRHADKSLLMEDGRIAEQGTHEDLLALDGGYARLWRVQTGERQAEHTKN